MKGDKLEAQATLDEERALKLRLVDETGHQQQALAEIERRLIGTQYHDLVRDALRDTAPTHPRPGVPSLLEQARATLERSLSEVMRLAEEKRSYAPTDAIGDARVEAVEEGP